MPQGLFNWRSIKFRAYIFSHCPRVNRVTIGSLHGKKKGMLIVPGVVLWGSTFCPYNMNENMLRILVTFTALVYSMLISTINIHSYKPYKTEPKYHLSRKCCFSYLKSKITSRMFDWVLESLLSNKFPIVLFKWNKLFRRLYD